MAANTDFPGNYGLNKVDSMQMDVEARHSELSELDSRALVSVFSAYTVSATLWLLFATGVGILMAFKFGAPEFGSGAWLTFGRLRPIHTNATFYGFASIALVGLAYYVAARSNGAKLYSAALAWIGPGAFQCGGASPGRLRWIWATTTVISSTANGHGGSG